ncbi:hypothetical protein [Dechloromonas sp. HYN0024]|uniref:hypothetical protein n=1 Tax=Dechloromonas sp. HYN0024 TaxID=2231055 RepID=UPI000E451398|nr:hypothetical protein [Dechloromonas sp. HYN0024]AXS80764.1 hypothetical protein HYN24_12475 [Dechloromonas sp. HYN0024]
MSVTRFPAISERKCRQGSHTRFGISDPHQAQQGHALLLLFLTLGFASTLFLTTWNNQRIHLAREQKTEQSLLLAKEALLAYALTYGELQRTNALPFGILTGETSTATLSSE